MLHSTFVPYYYWGNFFFAETSLQHSRMPEIQKMVHGMEEKGKANLNAEDFKHYLDSCCNDIMRIKEIKPDLHRQ